jgi:hypothetical protein
MLYYSGNKHINNSSVFQSAHAFEHAAVELFLVVSTIAILSTVQNAGHKWTTDACGADFSHLFNSIAINYSRRCSIAILAAIFCGLEKGIEAAEDVLALHFPVIVVEPLDEMGASGSKYT